MNLSNHPTKKYDVTLLTEAKYMQPSTIDWYTQQVLTEDSLVQAALEKKGLRVNKMNWDNADFDWESTACVVFRTTWDYSKRFDEFSAWLEGLVSKTQLINAAAQIYWNIDKYYLQDLNKNGVHIPPTKFIKPKQQTSLAALQKETGWTEMVLKPTVSAGGRHTYRLNEENLADYEAIFQKLIAVETMMLQPFLYNIVSQGEIGLMVIEGKVTHAVLKKAKAGDFRVQDDFGGSVELYLPTDLEVAFAEGVVAACEALPTYARVDIVRDNENKLALSEIELIEPEMWFRLHPEAATKLAEVIVKKIKF